MAEILRGRRNVLQTMDDSATETLQIRSCRDRVCERSY